VAREFFLPIGVMLEGVAVDSFVLAAMDGEVGLTVAVEIELAQGDPAPDWLFENAGRDRVTVPDNFARQPNVNGNDFHPRLDAETCEMIRETLSSVAKARRRGLLRVAVPERCEEVYKKVY